MAGRCAARARIARMYRDNRGRGRNARAPGRRGRPASQSLSRTVGTGSRGPRPGLRGDPFARERAARLCGGGPFARLRRRAICSPLRVHRCTSSAPRKLTGRRRGLFGGFFAFRFAARLRRGVRLAGRWSDSPLAMLGPQVGFDRDRYALMLRRMCRAMRSETGRVAMARWDRTGMKSVALEGGEAIEADFFVDCSAGSLHCWTPRRNGSTARLRFPARSPALWSHFGATQRSRHGRRMLTGSQPAFPPRTATLFPTGTPTTWRKSTSRTLQAPMR